MLRLQKDLADSQQPTMGVVPGTVCLFRAQHRAEHSALLALFS